MTTNLNFGNFGAISYDIDKTLFCFGKNASLYKINRPILHIPLHIILVIPLVALRDSFSESFVSSLIGRVACSITLGCLAVLGMIDAVARLAISLFNLVRGDIDNSKAFLNTAYIGLLTSLYYLTVAQVENVFYEELTPSTVARCPF
jgi:hypothetical protein